MTNNVLRLPEDIDKISSWKLGIAIKNKLQRMVNDFLV